MKKKIFFFAASREFCAMFMLFTLICVAVAWSSGHTGLIVINAILSAYWFSGTITAPSWKEISKSI